jgi:hypothetical protein
MKIHEYNEMMAYMLRPATLEEKLKELEEKYPGSVKPANELPPIKDPFKDFEDRNPRETASQGGRIGFYKGMSANKAPQKITKTDIKSFQPNKRGYVDSKTIRELDPNYLGDFEGGELERPKKIYQSGVPGSILDDAIEIRNIILKNKGNIFGPEELGEMAEIFGQGSRQGKKGNRPDIRRVNAALAVAKDNFPEIANFKFVTDRYKIDGSQRKQLNMVVDTIKNYQNSVGEEKLANFLPENMGMFYKSLREANPERGVYMKMYNFDPEQIKYITDRITDETGQKFTSKDYKNLVKEVKDFRGSIGSDARQATRLKGMHNKIVELANDNIIQNLLTGELDRPTQTKLLKRATELVGGDASIASRRLFQMAEAMSDTSNAYKNLGIKLNNNKANKIIATGRDIGGVNNRYGMSSVLYDYYGNVVDKALGAGEGKTFIGKYQQQIRNLLDKGRSPDEIFSLTASARRGLSPYAIFTQDLNTQVNSAIKGAYIDSALSTTHEKLQNIFKGRKYNQLNAKDKKAVNKLVEDFEKIKINALNQPTNPTAVKNGAKPIYLTAAEKKNIQLPEFDLKNPPSKSISDYKNFDKNLQGAFDTSYKNVGYSMKVPKEYLTQKQMITNLTQGVSMFGTKGKIAASVLTGVLGYNFGEDLLKDSGMVDKTFKQTASASDAPLVEEGFTTGEKLAGAGAAAGTAYKFGKPILSAVGKVLGAPSVAGGLSLSNILDYEKPEDASVLDRLDPRNYKVQDDPDLKTAGLDLLLPEILKKGAPRGSGIMSMIGRGLANPFGRAARAFTPVGATLTAAGIGKDYYDFAKDEIAKVKAMTPEEREFYNDLLMDEGGLLD